MKTSPVADPAETDTAQLGKLLEGCLHTIDQCDYLLQQINEDSYSQSGERIASIGSHMRHILDRFQCFFNGLGERYIDYDARTRDKSIETNLQAAQFAVVTMGRRLQELDISPAAQLRVRETVYHLSPGVEVESTVAREIMGLVTHTTHHLAIIGIIARGLGFKLDRDFGKAASTIVFESS